MTWSLLRATHIHPILTEEQPLLLLSLLERAGLSTELDLEKKSRVELPQLRKSLYELELNRLIERGTHFIRLTEHGRNTLDRLNLSADVIHDVLDSLGIPMERRVDCEDTLRTYRNSAYQLYQNSICTLDVWHRLVSEIYTAEPTFHRQASITGKRCFLFRDLQNWRQRPDGDPLLLRTSHGHAVDDNYYRMLLFEDQFDVPPQDARVSLHEALQLWQSDNRALQHGLGLIERAQLVRLIFGLHTFQLSSQPDAWFKKWIMEFKGLSSSAFRTNAEEARRDIHRIIDLGETCAAQSSHCAEMMAAFQSAWRPRTAEKLTDSFIAHLVNSESIDELASKLGLPKTSVASLLREVQQSCDRLCRAKQPNL